MKSFADLEVGIHRHDYSHYRVELHYIVPSSVTQIHVISNALSLDMQELTNCICGVQQYGQQITASLFKDDLVD